MVQTDFAHRNDFTSKRLYCVNQITEPKQRVLEGSSTRCFGWLTLQLKHVEAPDAFRQLTCSKLDNFVRLLNRVNRKHTTLPTMKVFYLRRFTDNYRPFMLPDINAVNLKNSTVRGADMLSGWSFPHFHCISLSF